MSLDIDVAANGELTFSPRWLYSQRKIPFLLQMAEIAFLLGFEDPNSFYRAFQDWTEQTPEYTRYNIHLN